MTTQHPNRDHDDDHDDTKTFNTFWPMVMMLITAIIFVIIIVIVCKRFCRKNGRPEWGPMTRSHGLDAVERALESRVPPTEPQPRPDVPTTDDSQLCTVFHINPPPYCEKPPAYDDISDTDFELDLGLPKYCVDNPAFEMPSHDDSQSSPSTSARRSRNANSTSSTSSAPTWSGPPPVYQPATEACHPLT